MRKFNLFKIFFVLSFFMFTISCHHLNNIETNTIEIINVESDSSNIYSYNKMYNMFERDFTVHQFDSICKADKILNDLNRWYCFASKDTDNGKMLIEYMYIKDYNNQETIYRLIPKDNGIYHITKRIRNK